MSVLLTVSPQQLTQGQLIFLESSADPKLLVPEASRDREWQCQTGSMERGRAREQTGIKKELEEGLHLMECDTGFEEGEAAGSGHRSLPQEICGTGYLSIHSLTHLLRGRHLPRHQE